MAKRDWQKDWERLNTYLDAEETSPDFPHFAANVLPYYLQRVRELEEENRKLRAVAEAAKPAAKALRFWLVESDLMCECEGETHICGYTERLNELKALEQALAALDGGGKPRAVIVEEDDGYCD